MKKLLFLVLVIVGVGVHDTEAISILVDSVGITSKGAKKFIVHQVEAGETLFALSRRYGVKVADIQAANPGVEGGLKIGQKILVPYHEIDRSGEFQTHIVQPSETLFSLSRKYGVKVEDLRKWNHLSDNTISVGQKLVIKKGESDDNTRSAMSGRKIHVVEPSQTLYSISRMYGVTTDQVIAWNHLSSTSLKIGQKLIVSPQVKEAGTTHDQNSSMLPPVESTQTKGTSDLDKSEKETADKENKERETGSEEVVAATEKKPESIDTSEELKPPAEKVVEKGMAEVIENSTDTKKYLALHRSAPIGTIMQVKNVMNNQSVFVRVVGQIPPTGDNSKVILKISKKAYDRLGAVDPRFPVEISYIP